MFPVLYRFYPNSLGNFLVLFEDKFTLLLAKRA